MWNKKKNPAEHHDPSSETDRELESQCGDIGGSVNDIDPEEIIAHEDQARETELRLLAEVEEWKSKYLRSLADFQNFQRRAIENEREARRQGVSDVVSQLLGVLDTFDLALKQDPSKATIEQIMQGVSMIRSQLMHALAGVGVLTIEPKPGDEFDPHRHEAVAIVPSADIEPGRIASTFQAGYTLEQRVLRPAKTSVAKSPEQNS